MEKGKRRKGRKEDRGRKKVGVGWLSAVMAMTASALLACGIYWAIVRTTVVEKKGEQEEEREKERGYVAASDIPWVLGFEKVRVKMDGQDES